MERSSFFNAVISKEGIPDRSYLAEDFARYFNTFIGNGVFPNPATQLEVIAIDNNMHIRIKPGYAWINGYMYENTDDYILTLDNADGVLDRIDRVVLRLDFLERSIKAVVKKGDWNSSAQAKNLQRDSDAFEIALADIKISKGAISISQQNVIDLRLNKNLCGIVHGVVDQADTTAIFNQFQSWYSTTQENYDKDISTWTKEKKEAFEKWYSENTTEFKNKFLDWFKNTNEWEKDFKTWFETIKEIFTGNIAGNLLNKINEINATTTKEITEIKEKIDSQNVDNAKLIGDIKDLKTTNKDNLVESINELFINVDDGKDNLYSAIIDKKVIPQSKDFSDLTKAVENIKLGQGNATSDKVLAGCTFTNDTDVEQVGTMPNMGTKEVTPTTYVQELGEGYYSRIKVNALDSNVLQNNFPNLKPENILQGVNIGGVVGTQPNMIYKKIIHKFNDFESFEVDLGREVDFSKDNKNLNICVDIRFESGTTYDQPHDIGCHGSCWVNERLQNLVYWKNINGNDKKYRYDEPYLSDDGYSYREQTIGFSVKIKGSKIVFTVEKGWSSISPVKINYANLLALIRIIPCEDLREEFNKIFK